MKKQILAAISVLGLTGVVLGAFGAHSLISFELFDASVFETAVRYQFYHIAGLLLCYLLSDFTEIGTKIKAAFWLMVTGLILFCGSLYLITALKIVQSDVPVVVGIATPIGGTLLVASWGLLLYSILKLRTTSLNRAS